jgi:uncharacterized lipoprotein
MKVSIFSLAVLGVAACSTVNRYGFLKDETQSYQKAVPAERAIVIPQNLSSRTIEDYYEVPSPANEANSTTPPIAPPGSSFVQNRNVDAAMVSQQDKIRNAEIAKIKGHTNPAANGPKPVGVNFSQAWVKAGHVLQASNYKIVERDRSMGTYYVIDTTKTGGKVKKDMPIYQVILKPSGNGTLVSIMPSNQKLHNELSRSLHD